MICKAQFLPNVVGVLISEIIAGVREVNTEILCTNR
jgi:hypothetical protein